MATHNQSHDMTSHDIIIIDYYLYTQPNVIINAKGMRWRGGACFLLCHVPRTPSLHETWPASMFINGVDIWQARPSIIIPTLHYTHRIIYTHIIYKLYTLHYTHTTLYTPHYIHRIIYTHIIYIHYIIHYIMYVHTLL